MTHPAKEGPTSRPKKRGKSLLIGLVVTLALLEGVSRLFIAAPNTTLRPSEDELLGYELAPGEHTAEGNLFQVPPYLVRVDKQGCRIPKHNPNSSPSEVLFIGDSFTFGDGVSYEDTFVSRLEQSLQKEGVGTSLRNCAVPGYNLTQLVRQTERLMENTDPALVMVGFFSNDLRGATPLQEMLSNPWLFGSLASWSRLLRLVNLGYLVSTGHLDPPHLETKEVMTALNSLEKAIGTTGKQPVALIIEEPHHPDLDFLSVLKERGWTVVMGPALRDASLRIPRDGHLNGKGHRLVAETLFKARTIWLSANGGLPTP